MAAAPPSGLMFMTVIVVLLLPDWTGSGDTRRVWVFTVPVLLGLAGAVIAQALSGSVRGKIVPVG
ncbi:hypothetical protein V6S67_17990 [Arthrobacter sp. Soc17.1.1.1]|uniref:hypothetical protein n=1 Tax=Arthrobacter sp. Soc17.1.1.1 TaxID=3121277 RepID=UPI002FE47B1C